MPKNAVNEWDATAGNNTDVGGINIAENCPAAGINNAMREIMAQVSTALSGSDTSLITGTAGTNGNLSKWNGDGDLIDGGVAAANIINSRTLTTTGGSGGVYTLTAPSTITAYANGQVFLVLLNHSGGGSGATLNIDSVGAVAIKKYDYTGSLVDPVAGDLRGGGVQEIAHDGTRFVLLRNVELPGEIVLANTSTGSGGQSLSWLDLQLTRFNRHVAKIDNLIPTVDGATFTFQLSSNGGSTWHDTAAYAYSGQDIGGAGAATAHASSSSGTINISTAVGNATGEHGLSGELIIMNAASATLKTSVHFKGQFMDASGSNHLIHLTGYRLTAGADNAARVRISSNIASGEIRWHGEVA